MRESRKLGIKISNLLRLDQNNGTPVTDVFLEQINDDAYYAYVPAPYPDKVSIFKPGRNYSYRFDPKCGWGDVITGPVEFIDLPADPGGIFLEPYVQVLAEKLKERISQIAEKKFAAEPARRGEAEQDLVMAGSVTRGDSRP